MKRQVARAAAAFTAALSGSHQMTRPELGEVLRAAGISPEGQRLPHLLMCAELDALIVSGPRKGKQFTYALLDERVAKAPVLDRIAGLAELTRRYFHSHRPAQLQDLAWWSGLTMADSRRGIALAGGLLEHETFEGRDYWFGADAGTTASAAGLAHLLPNWDEYTVGYRDRAALVHADRPFDPAVFAFGSILANVVIVEGRVHASWRRTLSRAGVRVEIRVLDRFEDAEIAAVEVSGKRFSKFLTNLWSSSGCRDLDATARPPYAPQIQARHSGRAQPWDGSLREPTLKTATAIGFALAQ